MPENNKQSKERKVTVSVISGRQQDNLKNCLRSLSSAALVTPLEVWVIDNCATFDVPEVIKNCYPDARIIKNRTVKGFGANHNQTLRQCQTEYALIS